MRVACRRAHHAARGPYILKQAETGPEPAPGVNGFMNRIAEFTLKRHAPGCKKARADVYHALKAKLPGIYIYID